MRYHPSQLVDCYWTYTFITRTVIANSPRLGFSDGTIEYPADMRICAVVIELSLGE
jgi:hypothetical protein